MICFSIAFGQTYLDRLFQSALPSLFAKRADWFSGEAEDLRFHLYTTSDWHVYAKQRTELFMLEFPDVFSTVDITVVQAQPGASPNSLTSYLAVQAVQKVLDSDEAWIAAWPDLVWSEGAVKHAYALHRMTDKTVALFNGRCRADAAAPANATVEYFVSNMDRLWQQNSSEYLWQIPGIIPGHHLYTGQHQTLIWSPAPNPFMGRFSPGDQLRLAYSDGLKEWDHGWLDMLQHQGRLIVQQDLNAGFSVEISSKVFSDLGNLGGDTQSQKEYKFGGRTWLFSQTRPMVGY